MQTISLLPKQYSALQQILAICWKILTVESPVELPGKMAQFLRVAYDPYARSKKTQRKAMSHARDTVQ
eukprot:7775782-Karenia_brevis.AAC.1